MILIAEIILTVLAWRRGWRAKALLPVGSAMLICLFIGIGVGASGGSVQDVMGICVLFDLMALAALIFLVARQPHKVQKTEFGEAAEAARMVVQSAKG